MAVLKVAVDVSGNVTTDVVTIPVRVDRDEAFLQVYISDAATVDVQVRVDPDLPFVSVTSIVASSLQALAKFHQIRLVISGNTGTVSASLLY